MGSMLGDEDHIGGVLASDARPGAPAVHRGIICAQPAAIRVFTDQGGDAFQRDWEMEAHVLTHVDHPNIISLLGLWTDHGCMCIATELCDASLETLLYPSFRQPQPPSTLDWTLLGDSMPGPHRLPALSDEHTHLPLPTVLSLGIHIAQGLAHLHPTAVHGNLKPSNVLLKARGTAQRNPSRMGSAGEAYKATQALSTAIHHRLLAEMDAAAGPVDASRVLVCDTLRVGITTMDVRLSDFRAAVVLDSPPSSDSGAAKPARSPDITPYTAPEVLTGGVGAMTPRSDMYSFGVVMWELLHRRPPWRAGMPPGSPAWAPHDGSHVPPDTLLTVMAGTPCPAPLHAFLERCMQPDPVARPTAAEAVVHLGLVLLECEGRARARSRQSTARQAAAAARAMVHAALQTSDLPLSVYGIPLLPGESLLAEAGVDVGGTTAQQGVVRRDLLSAAIRCAPLGAPFVTRTGTTIRSVRRWLVMGGHDVSSRRVTSAP